MFHQPIQHGRTDGKTFLTSAKNGSFRSVEIGNLGANMKRFKLVVLEPATLLHAQGSKNDDTRKHLKDIIFKQMHCGPALFQASPRNNGQFHQVQPGTIVQSVQSPTVIKFTNGSLKPFIDQRTKPKILKPLETPTILQVKEVHSPKVTTVAYPPSQQSVPVGVVTQMSQEDGSSSSSAESTSSIADQSEEESSAINTLSYFLQRNRNMQGEPGSSCTSSSGSQQDAAIEAGLAAKSKEYMRKRKIYKYESEKERRENKRDQNKEAARRYREKKKTEVEIYESRIRELEKINHSRQLKLRALETEKRVMVEQLKRNQTFCPF